MTDQPTPETDAMFTALDAALDKLASLQIQLNGTRDERERARAERDESWAENERLRREMTAAVDNIVRLRAALELIAAPMRPDGSYNRDRGACGSIARGALNTPAQ